MRSSLISSSSSPLEELRIILIQGFMNLRGFIMSKKKLTQKRLKELLHYDPETGIFTRIKKVRGGLGENPNEAGSIKTKHDYRIIGIDNKSYKASRLAFLYMEGYFPENIVDHKNRIKSDDRYKNLRQVTQQCNVKNCSIRKNNKSGVSGVFWEMNGLF